MRLFKWIFNLCVLALFAGFLHYTLPQHDIVRIVGAETRRVDFGENSWFWANPDSATAVQANRDVRFIETIQQNGKPMVYRNEDTGFSWPPYFKFDSSNLSTEAKELISTRADPIWVSITHYGWRNEFYTIFPNAVGVKQVAGPDVRIIPWFNIVLVIFLALCALGVYRLLQRFKRRRVDPLVEDVGLAWDSAEDKTVVAHTKFAAVIGRIKGWFKSWFG